MITSNGAIAGIGVTFALSPALVREAAEQEEAAMRMLVLCRSAEMINIASGEAVRREPLMGKTAAMRSVADDLMTGRLREPT